MSPDHPRQDQRPPEERRGSPRADDRVDRARLDRGLPDAERQVERQDEHRREPHGELSRDGTSEAEEQGEETNTKNRGGHSESSVEEPPRAGALRPSGVNVPAELRRGPREASWDENRRPFLDGGQVDGCLQLVEGRLTACALPGEGSNLPIAEDEHRRWGCGGDAYRGARREEVNRRLNATVLYKYTFILISYLASNEEGHPWGGLDDNAGADALLRHGDEELADSVTEEAIRGGFGHERAETSEEGDDGEDDRGRRGDPT